MKVNEFIESKKMILLRWKVIYLFWIYILIIDTNSVIGILIF
jgi:hypothetical protein